MKSIDYLMGVGGAVVSFNLLQVNLPHITATVWMVGILMRHSGMQQYTYAYKTRQCLQVASNLRKNHDYNTQGSWNKIN
jgi:hypothetical protein